MPVLNLNCTPSFAASLASACVNMWQSPVSSCGSRSPPTNLSFTAASAGSAPMQPARSSTSYGTPYCLSTAISSAGAVELLLLAEELQRALAALVILDADFGAQRPQAVAAVFGDRNHPALVDGVALCGAVAQHLQAPDPHHRIELGPDHQRPVPHQQPFDGFHRHAGAGPGRGIAGRDLAGIGERWFPARARPDGRRPLPHGRRAPDNRPW